MGVCGCSVHAFICFDTAIPALRVGNEGITALGVRDSALCLLLCLLLLLICKHRRLHDVKGCKTHECEAGARSNENPTPALVHVILRFIPHPPPLSVRFADKLVPLWVILNVSPYVSVLAQLDFETTDGHE